MHSLPYLQIPEFDWWLDLKELKPQVIHLPGRLPYSARRHGHKHSFYWVHWAYLGVSNAILCVYTVKTMKVLSSSLASVTTQAASSEISLP